MQTRAWFDTATDGFVTIVHGIDSDQLALAALGLWDVRALLGHTCRAFSTLEAYLAAHTPANASALTGPAEYFAAAKNHADPAQIAERGVAAGLALGDDPQQSAIALAQRVRLLVGETPDEAGVATPFGQMRLADYLPTRALEITVHSLDLARATRQAPPESLSTALGPAIALCTEIATDSQRFEILLALTGREPLIERLDFL